MAPKILFVFTSANKTLLGGETGWYLPEAAHPYYELKDSFDIDFAAPLGPNPPVDAVSVKNFTDDESVAFLKDDIVIKKLQNAKILADVKADDYVAIFYVGGHGPVLDLASDPNNTKLVNTFWKQGKIVSAVCHGTAAILDLVDSNNVSVFKGREATGFSNTEEEMINLVKAIPFLLETRIGEYGGKYTKAEKPFEPWVVVSGNLLTGQNPASAKPLAVEIKKALKAQA